jgi:hypothetical protein
MLNLLGCHEHEVFFDAYLLAKGAGVMTVAAALVCVGWVRHARQVGLVKGRIARGECVSCGYPIGTHERCTECGQSVLPPDGEGV